MDEIVPKLIADKLESLGTDLNNSLWNVYAGIVIYDIEKCSYEIISIGSGTKCLPDLNILDHPNSLVHDSHAEIMCRRSFLIFLYEELLLIKDKNFISPYLSSIGSTGLCRWNPNKKLILYSSQSPCGDASFNIHNSNYTEVFNGKRSRIDCGVSLAAGRETSITGILRTKPGRPDSRFASSMSCSDKIAIWNILGIQGALLTNFVAPIYLDFLLIGDGFDRVCLDRAIIQRTSGIILGEKFINLGYKNASNELVISKSCGLNFKCTTLDDASVFWFKGQNRLGHLVKGYKKGSKRPEKKSDFKLPLQCPLSRQYIFEKYFKKLKSQSSECCIDEKCASLNYQNVKNFVFQNANFKDWIVLNSKMKTFRDSL